MKTVWRVDSELLTIVEVEYNERMPIGEWWPTLLGHGNYAYFTTYGEAKKGLMAILDSEIEGLVEMRDNLIKEKE